MDKKLVEERCDRRPVTMTNVVLAMTVTVVIGVVLSGGFKCYSLSQRLRTVEAEIASMNSEEVRTKRQTDRGSCFVCPTGPAGPRGLRGYDGRNGVRGPTGARGPRGLTGQDGACGCDEPTQPAVISTYAPTAVNPGVGSSTTMYMTPSTDAGAVGYGTDIITTYADNSIGNKPSPTTKRRQLYTTDAPGYGQTTDYAPTQRRRGGQRQRAQRRYK